LAIARSTDSAANYFDPLPRVAVAEPGLDRIKEALLDRLTGMFRQGAAHRGSGTKRNGHRIKKKRCLRTITFVQPKDPSSFRLKTMRQLRYRKVATLGPLANRKPLLQRHSGRSPTWTTV
jgi:hypothetical protein